MMCTDGLYYYDSYNVGLESGPIVLGNFKNGDDRSVIVIDYY
jgi:hypothetical protein